MNLADLRAEIDRSVKDPSLIPLYDDMINQAILEIAMDVDLPALRRPDPFNLPLLNTAWRVNAPEAFHKRLFRCYDSAGSKVKTLERLEDLESLDWDHDETGDHITHILGLDLGEEKSICYYPKATETVKIWFYEKPVWLQKDEQVPVCIPVPFHRQVIVPKVIIRNFEFFGDLIQEPPHRSLEYWLARYRVGLYGSRAGEIGMINYFVRARGGPRRHGGRNPLP